MQESRINEERLVRKSQFISKQIESERKQSDFRFQRVLPSKFKQINQRLPSIKVGNFQLCESPLRLGQLQGNRFEIFIRNIPKTIQEQQIETYVNNWLNHGYINYFGLQRFGSRTLATQTVGK